MPGRRKKIQFQGEAVNSKEIATALGESKLTQAQNIIALQEAIKNAAESEERFRTVIENLPFGVFLHDLDGKIIIVNKTSCNYTGYTKEELLNLNVGDIDPQSVTREDRKNIWLQLQTGDFKQIESVHRRKDGTKYIAEININAITLKGKPLLLAIAQDITKRKMAEKALIESENNHQKAFEIAAIGQWKYYCRKDLYEWSERAIKVIGFDKENIPQNWESYQKSFHPDDKELILKTVDEFRTTGVFEIEHRLIINGKIKWVKTISHAETNDNSKETEIFGIIQDITDRKLAEEKLARFLQRPADEDPFARLGCGARFRA